tara:strand:+ start:18201 stop:18590 length:390 start_codon:yes stop_codon:yes gene_type:complete
MAVTVSGTSITFNDNTVQTTAATSSEPTTAQVLAATAGATAGAVGTYVMAVSTTDVNTAFNATKAGSGLRSVSVAASFYVPAGGTGRGFPTGAVLSGTWRAMGNYNYRGDVIGYTGASTTGATLWLRIS